MGLREYRRKRDFGVTPEPPGAERAEGGRSFVVQKHAASRLHYDFRLELEGVLKSWAVPKGPSLDPADKRLAMETEDHPVEYGAFEGVIPAGEYGGGTVVVWDQGTWEPVGDPRADYRRGAMKFRLHGRKLTGGFVLVRVRGRARRADERSWLLIKEKDDAARPGFAVVDEAPRSVVSDRTLEEVARDRDRVWRPHQDGGGSSGDETPGGVGEREPAAASRTARAPAAARKSRPRPASGPAAPGRVPGSRRAALPSKAAPQLATLVSSAPNGDEWLHEMKFDGYRILARLERSRVRLLSRHGLDWTARLPEVAAAVEGLPARTALLDGEVAVLLPDGTTSFQAMQNRPSGTAGAGGHLVYYLFDVLHLDGYDLTPASLESRKEALRTLLGDAPADGVVRFSDHVVGAGPAFHAQACRLSLEGVVSKRRDAPYTPGRGRDWVKVKCVREQEVVIGGFTPPEGARVGLGALLVGVHDSTGALRYAGKVGTGFAGATLRDLVARLERLEQEASPFADRVTGAPRARFVRPELVAQVRFAEWTADGRLRHPSFQGLREDKPARDVKRESEEPASRAEGVERRPARSGEPRRRGPSRPEVAREAPIEIEGVRLTHPGRVIFPATGTTKEHLARYYTAIAQWILPQLRGRPTTLVRCPDGLEGDCFYQKHAGYWAPPALRRVRIQEAKKIGEYLVVDDVRGLVGLAQLGILEIHTWNSVAEHLEQPDRLVFDLDPDPSVAWDRVVAAARRVRERLLELDLESFVKTTGGKGLHVVVPLQRGPGWDDSGRFAEAVAMGLARDEPEAYVAEMSKAKRRGRIFVDYLRNHRGSTSVAAYSTRARASAPVSTPLRWDELSVELPSDAFTIATLPARLEALRGDPWADYRRVRQRLTATRLRSAGVR